MPKLTTIVNAAAFAIGISLPAMGQTAYVWDTKGTQVATWVFDDIGRRTFSDNVDRMLGTWHNGLDMNVTFFYESANCTGQRYLFGGDSATTQQLVHNAYYENTPSPGSKGKTIWAQVEGQIATQHKYGSAWDGHESMGNTPECYVGDSQLYWMTPMIAVDTTSKGFAPPFCVAARFQECAVQFNRH